MKKFLLGQSVEGRGAVGILILRLVTGAAFIFHGWPKIQNAFNWMGPDSFAPPFLQGLAAFAEFGGGIALIIGLLTSIASLGIMCNMLVAIFIVHVPHGDRFVARGGGRSWELAAVYLSIVILLILFGPGKYSLDAIVFGKRNS